MLDSMMIENKLLVFNSERVFTALTGEYWFVCQYFIRLLIHYLPINLPDRGPDV